MLSELRAVVCLVWSAWALLLLAAGCGHPEPPAARDNARLEVPLSTPAGITLHPHAKSKGDSRLSVPAVVFADASGMTLYFRDSGAAGSLLTEAAVAQAQAQAQGSWSLLPLANGGRQWAYRGKALYRSALDNEIGGAESDGADGGLWHAAGLRLEDEIDLPGDLGMRETGDAVGVVLIDSYGMTLYTFEGDAKDQAEPCEDCVGHWLPMEAAQTAASLGAFKVVKRPDGVIQWLYKNRALYLYEGDQKPGDVTGSGIDPRFNPALIVKHFMPPNVVLRRHPELGLILATSNGSTLYTRDRIIPGEHQSFRDSHGSPALGRAFGTSTCDEACARVWPPLIAAAGSLPSGYWGIAKRTGGSMQWTYKGFALYTYSQDQPGEITGNGLHELAQIGATHTILPGTGAADVNVGGSEEGVGIGGLWWHAVIP